MAIPYLLWDKLHSPPAPGIWMFLSSVWLRKTVQFCHSETPYTPWLLASSGLVPCHLKSPGRNLKLLLTQGNCSADQPLPPASKNCRNFCCNNCSNAIIVVWTAKTMNNIYASLSCENRNMTQLFVTPGSSCPHVQSIDDDNDAKKTKESTRKVRTYVKVWPRTY